MVSYLVIPSPNLSANVIGLGWWGMDVRPQIYSSSFYVLANTARYKSESTNFTVSIRSNLTGEVWASADIPGVKVPTVDYVQLSVDINNKIKAPNSNNSFAITMDAKAVAGHTFYFSLVSLFPETYKNRSNGLRKDLAGAYADMKPKFLRFPGGNNMEGVSKFRRWKWWETVGPLKDRPGRQGNWGYFNTDGLGLLEYLEWTEDMDLEPVLALYSGYSLDIYGLQGTSYPPERMNEVLQEALDELEYCMGNTSTRYGALRAKHGHPEPFRINFVEVGNEDWFSTTYPYRWKAMYEGLKISYPNLTIISSTFNENANYTIQLPPGTYWDTHHYEQPHYFTDNFDFYDNWQATTNNSGVGVLLGEFSVFEENSPSGSVNWSNTRGSNHMFDPRLLSAISEGVYALGAERNPNTVRLSSYAPSLQNLNWYNWTPNMIGFTANQDETVLSASYWQQWLFSRYRGTHTLPIANSKGDFDPLWWASSIDENADVVYVKV
jgi:alpha-L-arabinofuranosidase